MANDYSKVLIVSTYFFPEPTGSAPPITDLALWLAENGTAPRVITARPHYPAGRVFDGYRKGEKDSEVWKNITISRLKLIASGSRSVLSRLKTELSFFMSLVWERVTKGIKSDYVISVCPSIFTVLGAHFFKTRGARHVCIVHDIQSGLGSTVMNQGGLMKALRILERFSLNRATCLITLTTSMREELEQLGVTKPIHILPPQVNVKEIQLLPEIPSETPILLYSGALGMKQGLNIVLEAAKIFQDRTNNAQFIIRGQGGEIKSLKAKAEDLELGNLVFEPLVPRDMINKALSEAVVHLVPQRDEGANFALPSKVFSIMSAGRPFVASTRLDSPLGKLANESQAALITPPGDAEAFANAIEELLKSPEKRKDMGMLGRTYVENNIDREIVCAIILELLMSSST